MGQHADGKVAHARVEAIFEHEGHDLGELRADCPIVTHMQLTQCFVQVCNYTLVFGFFRACFELDKG